MDNALITTCYNYTKFIKSKKIVRNTLAFSRTRLSSKKMIIFLFADFKIGGSQKIALEIFNELIKKKSNIVALSISNEEN